MAYRKFGRTADHRKALLRNLATSLILQGTITTTEHKAKDLRSVVDQLITLGKRGDIASRRLANQWLFNSKNPKTGQTAVQVLFDEVAPRYTDRNGGYTRVIKTVQRRGDGAAMARIELV